MTTPVITIENLSKEYIIGQKESPYSTFRETITELATAPFKRLQRLSGKATEEQCFLALKDINLQVNEGEVVGIIGRNGAGKSTLLKILSRITNPTTGRVVVRGRVASLLEVGTGFHPELTGRENIFLNGAILGMKTAEIRKKFEDIVEFAEVEKFLDTPVKRYSSGMYVRLAFAVAAHLEPEILLVDEVLAVGDVAFQRKCLGKMENISGSEGKTVLFVSHQMAAIQRLCCRSVLLADGQVIEYGKTDDVVTRYMVLSEHLTLNNLLDRHDRKGNGRIRFVSVRLYSEKYEPVNILKAGQNAHIRLFFQNKGEDLHNFSIDIGIDDSSGNRIAVLSTEIAGKTFDKVPIEVCAVDINIERLPLTGGTYWYTIYSTLNGEIADWIRHAGFFTVEAHDYYGSGKMPSRGQGPVLLDYNFQLVQ